MIFYSRSGKKRIIKLLLGITLSGFFSFYILQPVYAQPRVHLWPDVLFIDAGHFGEFTRQMNETRDSTRNKLWGELGDYLLPAIQAGNDAGSTALALADVLIQFDRMYDEHQAKAKVGIEQALNRQFAAAFGSLSIRLGLTDEERKVELQRFSEIKYLVKRRSEGSLGDGDKKRLITAFKSDQYFILYGSYTGIAGGGVILTLLVENIDTGSIQSLNSRGFIEEAVNGLAEQLFDYFQTNMNPPWRNPQPHLVWHTPVVPHDSKGESTYLATEADDYCKGQMSASGQHGRLPYTRELILASQGTQYRSGGIRPLAPHRVYLVADMQRKTEYHYYFGKDHSKNDPRGPVQTAGQIYPEFYCVFGAPSPDVLLEQDVFAALRNTMSDDEMPATKKIEIESALEYLILNADFYGKRTYFDGIEIPDAFPSVKRALESLDRNGFRIDPRLYSRFKR